MWLDDDVHAVAILVASIEDCFVVDIVKFDWAHQLLTFLRDRYEPIGQSTYLATIRQEYLL
jgi:hypothetical protein